MSSPCCRVGPSGSCEGERSLCCRSGGGSDLPVVRWSLLVLVKGNKDYPFQNPGSAPIL